MDNNALNIMKLIWRHGYLNWVPEAELVAIKFGFKMMIVIIVTMRVTSKSKKHWSFFPAKSNVKIDIFFKNWLFLIRFFENRLSSDKQLVHPKMYAFNNLWEKKKFISRDTKEYKQVVFDEKTLIFIGLDFSGRTC